MEMSRHMTTDDTNESELVKVTFNLSHADRDVLDRIVRARYPRDRQMMAKVLRELIREEEERLEKRARAHGGK